MKPDAPNPLPRLPLRPREAHKGDFGRALIVGGSRGMAGAAALAGLAALRGGAGLVTLAVPENVLDTVAGFEPSVMTYPLPVGPTGGVGTGAREALSPLLEKATCLAVGPGLGRTAEASDLAVNLWTTCALPAVFDADALFALAAAPSAWPAAAGPRIVTPHAGEFLRLVGDSSLAPEHWPIRASALARQAGCVVLLKGHRTLVTDGPNVYYNTTGNPGMATGGSGDVLTGFITALVCQGLAPFAAAQLGAYLHGLAGDLAARELGETSLIASDLLRYLPLALKAHQA